MIGRFKKEVKKHKIYRHNNCRIRSQIGLLTLSQNYPNPFNPITTIRFSVGTFSYTSLRVYDVLGQEVATLVSEKLPAGEYSRQWNAANMPSGIYIYRLQAGTYTETRKLVLLK